MKIVCKIILLLLCFSLYTELLAQPGGGGGVKIYRFHGSNKQYYSPSEAQVKKHLILSDSSRNAIVIREQHPNYLYSFPRYFAYELKPSHRSLLFPTHMRVKHENFQRIMVAHEKDTLLIDFLNIPMENPAGMYWQLDSVCLQTAYLRIDFAKEEDPSLNHMQKDSLKNYLKRGLTPSTLPFLERIRFVEKNPLTPHLLNQLLSPEKTPDGILEEVKYLILNDEPEKGLALLNELEERKSPLSNGQEIPFVKYFAHKKLNQLSQAERYLTKYIELSSNYDLLVQLVDLQLKQNQKTKALHTYEEMITHSSTLSDSLMNFHVLFEFYMNNFNDLDYLKEHCARFLAKVPKNQLEESPFYLLFMDYARLALIEGNLQAFEHHMDLAIEFGFRHASREEELLAFQLLDSLIQAHPKQTPLILMRCNLRLKTTNCLVDKNGRSKEQMDILQVELSQIEKKCKRNWKYFYYLAQTEFCHSNFRESLKAVNKSIKLHPDYPQLYMFRYRVRAKLNTAIKPYQEDPDMVLMEEKKKYWIFPLFENK